MYLIFRTGKETVGHLTLECEGLSDRMTSRKDTLSSRGGQNGSVGFNMVTQIEQRPGEW